MPSVPEGTKLAFSGVIDAAKEDAAEEAPAPEEDPWTTEVRGSADAYRRLGEIFLTVLAALPTATLLSSLIRAPGDAGLDESNLIWGVACAAAAVACGLALAIRLRAPVQVTEDELKAVKLETIIGAMPGTGERLLTSIDRLSHDATSSASARKKNAAQLKIELGVLRKVQEAASAEAMRKRVADWKTLVPAGAALALAAASVAFLALAPKPKPADPPDPAPAATVVSVRLSDAGVEDLGCPSANFSALQVGGDEAAPEVLPLGVSCEAGPLLKLKVEATGLATEVIKVTPVEGRSSIPNPAGGTGNSNIPESPAEATPSEP